MNAGKLFRWWQQQAHELKSNVISMVYAMRHPGTPWYARLFVALLVAYVVSPIDLIPDFIPVIGYLDDLVLIPIGVMIATRMIPSYVWNECKMTARTAVIPRSLYYLGVGIVLVGWIGTAYLLYRWLV